MTATIIFIVCGIVAVCASAIVASMLIDMMDDGDEQD